MEKLSNLKILISQKEIAKKVREIANKIDIDYSKKEIVILMILKGSICFVSDFIRELKTPFILENIQCHSYGKRGTKRGKLKIVGLEKLEIKNKHVIVVDDIFDSGNTMTQTIKALKKKKPKSIKSLVLLLKKTTERKKEILPPDYHLFVVKDTFVVGYGLDYKEYYRGYKNICYVENKIN
jgi:hypoxanthine phosphoribosyltransferase